MFFNTEFYPTHSEVIRDMVRPYKNALDKGITLCDPQAGKGDILDFIRKRYEPTDRVRNKYYCLEKNPELTMILQQKGYRFIDHDILTYQGQYLFDLIVMNPPFSNGDDHLLKAWSIMENGHIACLLNKKTIDNPFSQARKLLLDIISRHGSVTQMGQCFRQAERTTDAEVVLVRLEKKTDRSRFDFFSGMDRDQREESFEASQDNISNSVVREHLIESLVRCHDESAHHYVEYVKARERLFFFGQALSTGDRYKSLSIGSCISMAEEKARLQPNRFRKSKLEDEYNYFLDELKYMSWRKIFNDTKLQDLLTSDIRKKFEEQAQAQGAMNFTRKNISDLFDMLILNRNEILDQCLLTVFEKMTSYHSKNRIHVEGWKTNDAYKVNGKVIMPNFVTFDFKYCYNFSVNNDHEFGILRDIDKVMCYLSGRRFEEIDTISNTLSDYLKSLGRCPPNRKYDNICASTFFKIEFFKKGTLHLYFKDEAMLDQFNYRAAQGKDWLPDNYKERKVKKKKQKQTA
jgi:hypothetical protein